MIKILYLIDKIYPAGTQNNLLEIVKRLDRQRFEPKVIALVSGDQLVDEFKKAGAEPLVLGMKKVFGLSGLKTLSFLVRYMKKEKIDIVQTHFLQADLLGTVASKIAGVKKIVAARRDEGFWRSKRQLGLNRFLNRFMDAMAVNSEAVKKAVNFSEKFPLKKIRVIHNGVDIGKFYPSDALRQSTRKELGLKEDEMVIGVIANLRYRIKGHEYLIEAVSRIVTRFPKMSVILVGDGPLKEGFEKRTSQLGIRQNFRFLGVRKEIPALINAIDIACLPSLSEGFSNSILESMACGKAVVATEVGGNPEAVKEGATGFLVPARSAGALAGKLLLLLKDPTLRKRMGDTGRERILTQFTAEKMVKEYEEYYESILETAKERKGEREKKSPMLPLSHSPFRIMQVIWSLELGGAEQVVINLVNQLNRKEFEPVVCCLNEKGKFASWVEDKGIKVIPLHKRPKFDPFLIPKLVNLIKKEKIDLVHTHLFTGNLWGRMAAFCAGVPVVSTEHNVDTWKGNFQFFIDRILVKKNRQIIFVSQKVREFYEKRLSSLNGKARILYNGIDVARFSERQAPSAVREELGIRKGAKVIGIVGRLVPQKSHVDFLEAIEVLKKEGKDVVGLIVGDGPIRKDLEKRVKESGLDHDVIFAGVSSEMARLYQIMDIFALSSLREGFPLTILEAMASGVPVVSTNVGGVSECITDGKNGLLVAPGNSLALAQAISKLLADSELRSLIVKNAYECVKNNFSVEQMSAGYEKIYREVLGIGTSR